MKISLIGGTGHIGEFLTPMLVENGYEVVVIVSGRRPNPVGGVWDKVEFVQAPYKREDQDFFKALADIKSEVVIDIIGADLPGLYNAVKDTAKHVIACGSLWMFGPPKIVPTPPVTQSPCLFDSYTLRYKEMLEVKAQALKDGIAFSAVMPPNICGPGKIPLDAQGGRSIESHKDMMAGKPVVLPEPCETLVGPCDASDIARIFALAVDKREAAADEIFNAGSAYALAADELIAVFGKIYGVKIPIERVSWPEYLSKVVPDLGGHYHFREHMCPDISKTQNKLGFVPEFTAEQTLERAVNWMKEQGLL